MKIRDYAPADRDSIVALIAAFRVELAALRQRDRAADLAAAGEELQEYLDRAYPVLVAEDDSGECVGYLVCRVDGGTVWAESLFVSPHARRRGIAGLLYGNGEELARNLGSPTLYNWVHPNNDRIIAFLRKRGYDILNLIEIRAPREGEELRTTLRIGDHDYRY